MTYYGHTNKDESGQVLPSETWQPLREHLQNVASLAENFAKPFGMSAEASIAGLLHDLGKYSMRFQSRLRDPSIHGINHWSVGALRAYELRTLEAAFAIEGHHTGMPALLVDDKSSGLGSLKNRLTRLKKFALPHPSLEMESLQRLPISFSKTPFYPRLPKKSSSNPTSISSSITGAEYTTKLLASVSQLKASHNLTFNPANYCIHFK